MRFNTRHYRMKVLILTIIVFLSYIIVYKSTTSKIINNLREDIDANLDAGEIQELYTKNYSMLEIESRVKEERTEIEEQLSGITKHRLSDVILIGMFKGGTGTMTSFLTHHPQVVEVTLAEFYSTYYKLGHIEHMAHMPNVSIDNVIYERCTLCYTSQDARERILAAYPEKNVKFLIMVRDPIERLISGYVQNQYYGQRKMSFKEYIFHINNKTLRTGKEYFEKSFYVSHLARWLMLFPKENIHLVDAGIFIETPWIELEKIEQFLKIEHFFSEDKFPVNPEKPNFHCLIKEYHTGMRCMGRTKGRSHPEISIETMETLKKYFKPYNEQFFTLADQRFSWEENYE
ncbi:unnamed protein product [Owenia fusiformis]|uniref:Uncharacterized protein n=1 Tax=Owenia fusiformis TaxID=6347 RepID=A0A8J1XZT7_OWEFU|nr:unnamed protein product [Owenia fusiformis]